MVNRELVEQVTRIVLEKMNQHEPTYENKKSNEVKFWDHRTLKPEISKVSLSSAQSSENVNSSQSSLVEISKDCLKQKCNKTRDDSSCKVEKEYTEHSKSSVHHTKIGIENPLYAEELKVLVDKTPARIGVGRAGTRPKTNSWLKFRYDHAAAVDTVYGEVDKELLKELDLFTVETLVDDKEVYIRRPDLGRKLSEEAKQQIQQKCVKSPTVQIIVSDGLSSNAINENLEDVYLSLEQSLKRLGLDVGTPFFISKGRVAIMDEIGELLKPKVVVLFIGERPGLVSAESLSAYLCYEPRKGTIEADRMVISNIHKGGIPPVEAGAYIGTVVEKVLKYEASGINLIQKEQ